MFTQIWDSQRARSELQRLIASNLLGFFDQVEITHVFAVGEDRKHVSNVFTLAVLEEHAGGQDSDFHFLNGKTPLTVRSMKERRFGIARHILPVQNFLTTIDSLLQTTEWSIQGKPPLRFGTLASRGPQFVPPDAISSAPWNAVLKNNFWNGSYIFEWADHDKTHLEYLFDQPERIQGLSEEVQKYVPIRLASLSDRLGNLVIQIPVRILISTFHQPAQSGDLVVNVAWHPRATPRPLKAFCHFDFDNTVQGAAAADITAASTTLPAKADRGTFAATIIDESNRVLLASTGTGSFIETIASSINMVDPEPRLLNHSIDGKQREIEVALIHRHRLVVGRQPDEDWNGGQTFKRMYRDEVALLKQQRRFMHFTPRYSDRTVEHEHALDEIRRLIAQYGEHGVWLWDPYLTAHDILETLVYCPYANADLRGLASNKTIPQSHNRVPHSKLSPWEDIKCSAGELKRSVKRIFREPPPSPPLPPKSRAADEREVLNNVVGNWRGIRLEYRLQYGNYGWGFHDRFLIFPGHDRGALAWSLGTSVNSLGKEHHIIQQVDDGQLVMDEFKELWDQLNHPQTIVWKKP